MLSDSVQKHGVFVWWLLPIVVSTVLFVKACNSHRELENRCHQAHGVLTNTARPQCIREDSIIPLEEGK